MAKQKSKKSQRYKMFKKFKPFPVPAEVSAWRKRIPLVGDWMGTEERGEHGRYIPKQGGMQRIEYNYPQEPGGLEEGIMGIPMWALLLGGVLAAGLYLKFGRK